MSESIKMMKEKNLLLLLSPNSCWYHYWLENLLIALTTKHPRNIHFSMIAVRNFPLISQFFLPWDNKRLNERLFFSLFFLFNDTKLISHRDLHRKHLSLCLVLFFNGCFFLNLTKQQNIIYCSFRKAQCDAVFLGSALSWERKESEAQ